MRISVIFTWKQLIETQSFEFSVRYWVTKHVSFDNFFTVEGPIWLDDREVKMAAYRTRVFFAGAEKLRLKFSERCFQFFQLSG
jgi:hypothetical protein